MTPQVRHAGEFDFDLALDFLRENHLTYLHPDWLSPQERLVGPFTYVLAEGDEILAILCTAREDPEAGWIRFYSCLRDGNHRTYFDQLISASITEHRNHGTGALFSTATTDWITTLLQSVGFGLDTQVITLSKHIYVTPSPAYSLTIRNMEVNDFASVLTVDKLAFSPEWRLDQASLEHAFSHSAIATVGLKSNQVIAYTTTNAIFDTGHLNRLAVHPTLWGQRLGEQMLEDLNSRCIEQGISQLTVNTQENNLRSIALYQRTGFRASGEAMPIYQLNII